MNQSIHNTSRYSALGVDPTIMIISFPTLYNVSNQTILEFSYLWNYYVTYHDPFFISNLKLEPN